MATPIIQGNLQDKSLLKEKKIDLILPQQFSGLIVESNGVSDVMRSLGTGNPEIKQVSTLGFAALSIEALNDTVHHFMRIPRHWDLDHELEFAVVFATSNTTASQTVTFTLKYDQIAAGSAIAEAATALDTAIPAATDSTTAFGIVESSFGKIDGFTLTRDRFLALSLAVTASDLTLATTPVLILGLLVRYYPRLTGRL